MHRTITKLAMTVMLGVAAVHPAASQGLSQGPGGEKAIEGIVGDSDIRQEKTTASAEEKRVLAAIDKTADNISIVRKLTAARQVDIVFLADAVPAEGGPPPAIERKLKEHRSDVLVLRQEVEGNALLFHAVDSKRVMMKDILAVEFPDPETVIVYAASRPAG
ncbi:MAG: hypothetical protein WBG88_08535 [Mesorhizobium sp.]